MTVKITVGSSASNKPPVPQPSPDEYPIHLTMEDQRQIWVSVPKPDKIVLIAPLEHKHFLPLPKSDEQFEEYIFGLSQHLATDAGLNTVVTTKMDFSKKFYSEVAFKVGAREAVVFIKFMKPKQGAKPQPWKLRIEFNPRKLGPVGIEKLTNELSYVKTFRIARFLADARLTRLDVAVDFIGVEVSELLATVSKSGKTSYFVGDDGKLETVMLHRALAAPKQTFKDGEPSKVARRANPLGKVLLKLYDKVKERAAVLQPAPFGITPVTRLELVKTWNGNGPTLLKLTAIANPLAGATVSYVACPPPGLSKVWQAYVAGRRLHPASTVATQLGLSVPQSLALQKAFNHSPHPALKAELVWAYWGGGLSLTGLQGWLDLASLAPEDKFEGGQI